MKKIKKTIQLIPIDTFAAAFIQLMGCTREEIHIEMLEENQSAFVIYNEQPFKINTREYLFESVKPMLTDIHEAQQINPTIWAEVTRGALRNPSFYLNLISNLEDITQVSLLQFVFTIDARFDIDDELFWLALDRIDRLDENGTLYGAAIVAAAKLYDLDRLANDLFDAQIINGQVIYNHFVDGIFKDVYLPVNGDENFCFYIYSAMP
ncbi:hypothetical protein [uncultured Mucilaginibacter sp.]|uniref:hypothetical protein n=1 Tax=uncultured Mucilaginibacter sp. TaxID=797541 RepID=UPI0025FE8392|nr:hypothetical protein [uncultured Mucilaginibacter sp.]